MNNQVQTRARITKSDAVYLAFLSRFPAADSEAMSYLAVRQSNPFGAAEGELTDPSGVEKRLQKLLKLGAVVRFRSPVSGTKHYGITRLGYEASLFYNYETTAWRSINDLSISRLEHYKNIALIAAQLVSPVNYFSKELGLEAVSIEQLVSENSMRKPYDSIKNLLKKQAQTGSNNSSFGLYRKNLTKRIVEEVKAEAIKYSEIMELYPQLYTLGTSENSATKMKPTHQPDLAVNLDSQRNANNPKAKNILVEIELSQKSAEEYERILRTFKHEFASGAAYDRAVYFVGTQAIANTLKKVDSQAELELIKTGKLVILPIKGRDKKVKTTQKRVVVPKVSEPTVSIDEQFANISTMFD